MNMREMIAFTSLAILGNGMTQEELRNSNDITATTNGLMIVAFVAVAFCLLGAFILFFYNEKKVMKTIAKDEDKEFLMAIEGEDEILEDNNSANEVKEAERIVENNDNTNEKENIENE